MEPTLAIGDFSRATHLSVKMLRHYHDIGLLEPAAVDPYTGYRRYGSAQIATAQVIRRFRARRVRHPGRRHHRPAGDPRWPG